MSTAVVVTYQSATVIEACLTSLAGMRVIVVDNASTDGTTEIVAQKFNKVELIRRSRNDGLAVAVNEGIQHAGDDDVLILNPDTVVLPGAIAALECYLTANPRVGVVAPRLRNDDGGIQESIRTFPNPMTMAARRSRFGASKVGQRVIARHLLQSRDDHEAGPIPWALGAAMLVRRGAITAVGNMDEWFFLYNEDIDWCYRMWRKGWEVHYVPQAEMIHAYQRASTRPLRARCAPTRHHWKSIFKLFVRHPEMLVGICPSVPRGAQEQRSQQPAATPYLSSAGVASGLYRVIRPRVRFEKRVGRS